MMNIKLDKSTPESLAALFIFLLREGITPDQIMVGIIRLSINSQDSQSINSSVGCLRCLLGSKPIDASAEGLTEFIAALGVEEITTLMALDALSAACQVCGFMDAAGFVRISYLGLKARSNGITK
jgi:hypothetical protein